MPVMNLQEMEFAEEPTLKPDILKQVPYINGGHPNAVRPMENLSNRYYANSSLINWLPSQALPIARTNPPVMAEKSITNLDKTGFGSTYRLSDEALRQYSLGTYLHRSMTTYYQTRP